MKRSWITLAAGLALVLATAGTAAATVTASEPGPSPPPSCGPRRQAARVLVGHRQLAGHGDRPRAVQRAADRRELRRLHRDDRELVGLPELQGRLPRLFPHQRGAGPHQLHHLPQGHRRGLLLVHGRPRRGPALQRLAGRSQRMGRAAGGADAGDIAKEHVNYPVIWATSSCPASRRPDNGWNNVYTAPCSGVVKQSYVAATLDRADFNGFASYITAHSSYKVGVYSSGGIWASIFGTGSAASIPDTYEWTYEPETTKLAHAPSAGA